MGKKEKNPIATKKAPKVTKGGPSGLVISLIVHAAAFFVAGLFVVFTVLPKAEPEFEAPPPVERPKMKLKKPKVKIKKSSQPKPSSRIVAKVKTAKMPEIQIPDLVGTGDSLLGNIQGASGDLIDLPDIGEVTIFGGKTSIGNDLKVSYYNLNFDRGGGVNPISGDGGSEYEVVITDFISRGFDKSVLRKYYRSPRALYATTVMIPTAVSTIGPNAFGEDMNYGFYWCALFEGKLVHKDGITFRFWGSSDDVLNVQLDGELVLAANFNADKPYANRWQSPAPYSRQLLGNTLRVGSDWITLEPGVARDIKVIVGENAGGEFGAQLLVEVEGKEYELNDQGSPIYEVFAMDEISWELQDQIMLTLTEGEANVTNVTTIFRDY
jgi:hypothetical protein